ncbi:MAG: CheR family methyltransferase [Desulfobulbaceae bacterium]|nr:CheR family methyltransferase [Desulfobulbaceae bacterium]
MQDNQCVNFLQWALPVLNMRWQGFRKVRRQVCRRIDKRMNELRLGSIAEYRQYLQDTPEEWPILDQICRITISRFYRDNVVFDYLASDVFPALTASARDKNGTFRVWSCGCASGEEPYTAAMLWHYTIRPCFPEVRLEIIGTDIDPALIGRAQNACYRKSALREMPPALLEHAFVETGHGYCVNESLRQYVRFEVQDVRKQSPGGKYQVVFCRNLAFTYFAPHVQEQVLRRFARVIETGGVLVTGSHELHAGEGPDFVPWIGNLPIFQKI